MVNNNKIFLKGIVIICILVTFICFSFVWLEAGEKNKYGYFNYREVLDKSEKGKATKKMLQDEKSKKQAKYDELVTEIKKQKEELEKKEFALKPERKIKLEEEIRRNELQAKRMYEDGQADLTNMEKRELAKFNNNMQKVIDKIGEEEGYTLIFQMRGSGIVYANPKADLTDKIINLLNK